jgi:hypothetical protein
MFSNFDCNSIFGSYISIYHEVSGVIISSSPCMKPFFHFLALEHLALPFNGNLSTKIKVHFGLYNLIYTKPKIEDIFGELVSSMGALRVILTNRIF